MLSELSLALLLLATPASALEAPSADPPCGAGEDPACWAQRLACSYAAGPLRLVSPPDPSGRAWDLTDCPMQPGCCNGTRAGARFDLPVEVSKCENYGIQVNVVVASTACDTCNNHGVTVDIIVLGSRCTVWCEHRGISVSVGEACGHGPAAVCMGHDHCWTLCKGVCASEKKFTAPCQDDVLGLCDCDGKPSVSVGITQCPGFCDTGRVSVVVGIQECGACGQQGIRVVVGFACDRGGVGVCIDEVCKMVIDQSGEPGKANQWPMGFLSPQA